VAEAQLTAKRAAVELIASTRKEFEVREFETFNEGPNMFENEELEGSSGFLGDARDQRRRRAQEAMR
jgi:hypothetical protein